jgi:hypothetical protein
MLLSTTYVYRPADKQEVKLRINHGAKKWTKNVDQECQFLATYSHIILPSNGPRMWPATDTEAINPPLMRRAPGRPKKKRNRSNDEPKDSRVLPRHLSTVQCKKCLKFGHNIRSCKGKTAADREIPKGGNKKKINAGKSDVAPTGAKKQKKSNAGPFDAAPGAKKQKKTTKAKQTKTSETEPSMQTESSVQVAVVVTQSSQAPQTQGSQADV